MESPAAQESYLGTIQFADARCRVHIAFQQSVDAETGIFEEQKRMLVAVPYRHDVWCIEHVAFIAPDRVRRRASGCAGRAQDGTDNHSGEALAHGASSSVQVRDP